jgi:hypothetical protein
MIRIILATLAALLAATSAAHAEPISGAIALITGILAKGGIGALLLKTAFSVALSFGAGLLQRALGKEPPQAGVKFDVEIGDDNPIGFVAGAYATAGTRKYAGVHGQEGKTPNAYFVDVVQIGDLPAPMSETNRPSLFVNGEKVTIDWDATPSERGYPVLEYREDDSNDHLWVWYLDGTQTAANSYLVDKFGSHPDRPWDDDMIGFGCPALIITAQANSELFSGGLQWLGEPPVLRWYDVRKDATAGGDGAHRWNDQSTWEPSKNPAVIIYNLIRGVYYDDGDGFREWVYGGQDLPAWRLPAANWMAAANECDAEIDLGGGTELQFRCGFEVRGDMEPLAVIEELLKACNGRIACVGGVFKIQIGLPGSAVYSFTDDHIVITKGQSFEPFPSLDATHNGIEATYPEPAEAWAMKDAPARYSSTLEAEDGDRRLATGIAYAAAPYATQVQRLMKAAIEDARRFRVHSFYLPPDAAVLEPAVDMVSWTSPRNGYVDKKFLLMRGTGERTMNQLVVLKEVDPADGDWNPGTDEMPVPVGPLGPIRPAPQVISGFGVEATTFTGGGAIPTRPAIRLYWDWGAGQRDIEAVQFSVRLDDGDVVIFDGRTDRPDAGQVIIAPFSLMPSTDYEVQARFVSKSKKRKMAWSAWLPVTTVAMDMEVGSGDVLDDSITAAKIQDAAVTANKLMNDAVTELKIADRAVTNLKVGLLALSEDLIQNDAIISRTIAALAVSEAKVAAAAITVNKIGDLAVSTGKIAATAITEAKLDTAAVTEAKLAALAVSEAKVAANAITVNKVASNAIEAGKIASSAVTETKIASDSVTSAKIVAGTITASDIAAGTITASQIAAGTITASQIAAGTITASEIASGAITAAKVAAKAITVDKLVVTGRGSSILPDPQIEDIDWWSAATTSGTIDTFQVLGPSASAYSGGGQVWVIGSTAIINWTKQTPIDPNKTYLFRVVARRVGTEYGSFYFGFNFHTSNGTLIAGVPVSGWPGQNNSAGRYYHPANVSLTTTFQEFVLSVGPQGTAGFPPDTHYVSLMMIGGISGASNTDTRIGLVDITEMARADLIVDGAIIADKVAANAISAAKIQSNAITAVKIDAGAITAVKIDTDAVIASKIQASAVTTVKIATNAVTANEIAAGTITATEIAAGAVTAVKIQSGTITGDKIAGSTITGNLIVANSITTRELILTDFENLVPVNTFDIGTADGWSTNPLPSGVAFVTTGSIPSPYSLRFDGTTVGVTTVVTLFNAGTGTKIPVVPGESISIQFDYQTGSSGHSRTIQLRLTVYDKTGTGILTVTRGPSNVGTSGVVTFNDTFTIPADAAYIGFAQIRASGSTGTVFIGNIFVRKQKNASLIVDGAIIADKIATNAVVADKIATNAITTNKIQAGAVGSVAIDDATITNAKIANLTITSGKIAANAVTSAGDDSSSGGVGVGYQNTWVTVADFDVESDSGNPVLAFCDVAISGTVSGDSGSNLQTVEYRLRVGTTVIASNSATRTGNGSLGLTETRFGMNSSGTGTKNVNLQIRRNISGTYSATATVSILGFCNRK